MGQVTPKNIKKDKLETIIFLSCSKISFFSTTFYNFENEIVNKIKS